jgi:pyruvate-ferredoxin/flavodoxin oxidoreductase
MILQARGLLKGLSGQLGDTLVTGLLEADMGSEAGIAAQRHRVAALKTALAGIKGAEAQRLALLADYLVRKNVWIVGGDGWAYDIGYGGLDHVLSTTRNVNVLILDTEVYSNTGGQASKSTPTGASAKFASAGKEVGKKDIGLMAMAYGHVYVARVAFGAKDVQTVKAFQEAESYDGPSMIIAYSHCIAHGYDMAYGAEQQKLAVDSGVWPLYRFDPRRPAQGLPPLQLDSGDPKVSAKQYMRNETRFRMVEKLDPERFKRLLLSAEKQARQRVAIYKQLSGLTVPQISDAEIEAPVPAGAKN